MESFVLSTAMLYYVFIIMNRSLTYLETIPFLAILIIGIIIVLAIVLTCNWTSDQVTNTTKILRKLSLKKKFYTQDIDELIRVFLMQIKHHDFTFTVAGLFNLDSTLLQSVIKEY